MWKRIFLYFWENKARMTERKIIHIDMDAFFAAVEQRDNQELRGKPVAVGFDGPRGVVSTASYEARKYGVHSAQSIAQAKQRCPNLIIVPCRHDYYAKYPIRYIRYSRNIPTSSNPSP